MEHYTQGYAQNGEKEIFTKMIFSSATTSYYLEALLLTGERLLYWEHKQIQ